MFVFAGQREQKTRLSCVEMWKPVLLLTAQLGRLALVSLTLPFDGHKDY